MLIKKINDSQQDFFFLKFNGVHFVPEIAGILSICIPEAAKKRKKIYIKYPFSI